MGREKSDTRQQAGKEWLGWRESKYLTWLVACGDGVFTSCVRSEVVQQKEDIAGLRIIASRTRFEYPISLDGILAFHLSNRKAIEARCC